MITADLSSPTGTITLVSFAATRATVSASFPFSTLTSPITSSLATMVVYFKLSNAHSKSDFASTKEHLVK